MAEAVSRVEIKTRPRTMLLVVNGKIVQDVHVLKDGDELRLVPGVSGGAVSFQPPERSVVGQNPRVSLRGAAGRAMGDVAISQPRREDCHGVLRCAPDALQ